MIMIMTMTMIMILTTMIIMMVHIRYTKFQGVSIITLHFPNNFRHARELTLHFIGLKGNHNDNDSDNYGNCNRIIHHLVYNTYIHI